MINLLIKNEFKSLTRSRNSGASIFAKIFLAILIIYLLLASIILGILLKSILNKFSPNHTISSYCSLLFYYFLIEIPIRYWAQELPTLSIKPYLLQNVNKVILIRFLNLRSLISIFNIIPLFIFTPFLFQSVKFDFGNIVVVSFIISIIFTTLGNHFFVMYLKRKSILNTRWLIGIVLIFLLFTFSSKFNFISFTQISEYPFNKLLHNIWLSIIPILYSSIIFYINAVFLKSNFYIDIEDSKKNNFLSLKWADNFGELISNEIKLILRNKRSRNTFLFSLIFLLYGVTFYKEGIFELKSNTTLLIIGYMITNFSSLSHMQFLFSWQTAQFDQLMTAKHGIKKYIASKINLIRLLNTFSFTFSLFYAFIDWRIIPLHLSLFFFNIGLIIPICTIINLYNSKGLDLSQGTSMNYQGVGIYSFISSFIPILILIIFQYSISYFLRFWTGITLIGFIGIISLFLQHLWLEKIENLLNKRKYLIVSGFKQTN
jgi:hypothetical protein